jgi:hypothetical protein
LVHKNASAQRHFPVVRTRKGILYHTKAGFRHGNMKLGGEYFRGLSSPVKIGQIQEKRGPIEDLYLVFRMSDKPTGSGGGGGHTPCGGFETDRRLAFVGDGIGGQAQQGGHCIEETAS